MSQIGDKKMRIVMVNAQGYKNSPLRRILVTSFKYKSYYYTIAAEATSKT